MSDLYAVQLNPQDGGAGGSLAGSDVGANEQDDQRVRDLHVQDHFFDKDAPATAGSSDCIDGWYRTGPQQIQSLDEGAVGEGGTFTESHTITIPAADAGTFLEAIISAKMEFYYDADTWDVVNDQANIILTAELYIDGLISSMFSEYFIPHLENTGFTWYWELPISFTEILSGYNAGDHTFKINWKWSVAPGFGGHKNANSVGFFIWHEFFKLSRTCITDVDPFD